MFDGVPEQFHQFIAPRNSLPLQLSFLPFDAYNPSPHHLPLPPPQPPLPNLLSPLHHKHEQHEQQETSMNLQINEREPRMGEHKVIDSTWTDDEVFALLRIRSSLDAWFPDLPWEHVSRKLAELGFKRSAEKCKEKFEEETSYFNNIHYTKNSCYRFISELEQLYQQEEAYQIPGVEVEVGSQESKQMSEKPTEEQHRKMDHALEDGSGNDASLTKRCEETVKMVGASKGRKRKRNDKFEILKGFCENIVNKMMAKQEHMHNKLLEDMFKRDQEIFARGEAWKKQEIDRMNRELEMMAKEQAVAGQRQAAIIDLLKKISDHSHCHKTVSDDPNPNSLTASSPSNSQNPNPCCNYTGENNLEPPPRVVLNCTCEGASDQNPDSSSQVPNPSSIDGAPALTQNPKSVVAQTNGLPVKTASTHKGGSDNSTWREKEVAGRRWPREEVVALINLRCSENEEREGGGSSRVPLWERISEGMREMGYNRSAKRCKEKWENINKYFRKTKSLSKKRSVDSRTCPYFHQLTSLYSQGMLHQLHDHDHRPSHSSQT